MFGHGKPGRGSGFFKPEDVFTDASERSDGIVRRDSVEWSDPMVVIEDVLVIDAVEAIRARLSTLSVSPVI